MTLVLVRRVLWPLSSSCKSWISSSALVLKEASKAPASVPVASSGLVCRGGLQATAAVRLTSFNDIPLLLPVVVKLGTIKRNNPPFLYIGNLITKANGDFPSVVCADWLAVAFQIK